MLPETAPTQEDLAEQDLADLYHAQQDAEEQHGYTASFEHVEAYLERGFDAVESYWVEQGRDPGGAPEIEYSINKRGASYNSDHDGEERITVGLPGDGPLEPSLFDVYVHEVGHQYNQQLLEQHTDDPSAAAVAGAGGELDAGIDEGFMQLWTYSMCNDIGDREAREDFIQKKIQEYSTTHVDEENFAAIAMEISERMADQDGDPGRRFRAAYSTVEDEVLASPDTRPGYVEDPFNADWIERLL